MRRVLLISRLTSTKLLAKRADLVVQLQYEFFQPLMLFGKPPILFQHHGVLRNVIVAEVTEERLRRLVIALANKRRQRTQPRRDLAFLTIAEHGQFDGIAGAMLGNRIGQVFRPRHFLTAGADHHVARR